MQAFTLENHQQEQFDKLARHSLVAGLEAVRLQARFSPVVDATAVLSTVAVLWIGGHRVIDGRMSVGDLLVFISYVGTAYKPLKALSKLGGIVSKGSAAAERLHDVLGQEPQVRDRPGAILARPLTGRISFKDVHFSYGREAVLHGIDLTIESGETVALIGPTGAGKSTIAALIPRLADPTSGCIEADGHDLRSFGLAGLRAQVSMVLQDCTLLRGTLHDNIRVGRPNAAAWEIERAAELALVTEFSSRMPNGLDTMIGERGADLSGGQRQRIAIARAILRNAPILILDEPTSALDAHSEQSIVTALGNLPSGRTTIVIAHRLSTVRSADRLIVIDGGRIVEQGTHDQLLKSGGRYCRLHELQQSTRRVTFDGVAS